VAFVAALALLFWLPELVLGMGWANSGSSSPPRFHSGRCSPLSFNLLMGYAA